jgi:hypothetical protein
VSDATATGKENKVVLVSFKEKTSSSSSSVSNSSKNAKPYRLAI